MSTISLRLPESLHKRARELAKKEKISINRLVSTALAEKMSALMAGEYLEKRAARGNTARFKRALARVSDRAAEERDRL
ncbi:MAG: toxin-antitoxin system HicB family antitoxin [Betaproteobacteria bacterium]|nr:toxin-antitoxin system HicB family antitoxin [Betaproteobacteria bacterium]